MERRLGCAMNSEHVLAKGAIGEEANAADGTVGAEDGAVSGGRGGLVGRRDEQTTRSRLEHQSRYARSRRRLDSVAVAIRIYRSEKLSPILRRLHLARHHLVQDLLSSRP